MSEIATSTDEYVKSVDVDAIFDRLDVVQAKAYRTLEKLKVLHGPVLA